MPLEKPVSQLPGLRRIFADSGASYAAAAIVAFLFAASGPVAIILSVGARGGLSESDIASWIFAAFSLNSVISIAFTLACQQPLIFLWSIPGSVLVGPALGHLSFPEVVGAFLATGVLMLLLGLSGWVRRAMDAVPMPIVMTMVAGVFLRFGVDLVLAFRDALWIALPMAAAFFLATRISRFVPPLIAALIAGAIAVGVLGAFKPPAGALFALAAPNLYVPQFSWAAMVELVVPLAITVLAVQNAQGIAILADNGHQAPVNAITAACGVGSIVTGLFGAVSTCLTRVRGFVRRTLQLRRADMLPGDGGRRTDPADRCAVLGAGARPRRLLAIRPRSMTRTLSLLETRVLGTLYEKQHTVPDSYPLTLNALVSGCNQKTSRAPVMEASDAEVQAALDSLKSANFVMETSGGRVSRYSHNLERVLQVPSQSAAILTVLMLRGPQTAGELRINCERLHSFSDISAVQGFLDELASRAAGALVVELPRLPGARENRWAHLLSGSPKTEAVVENQAEPLKATVMRLEGELAELKALVERISKQTGIT